jgi:type I restriction enzyme R subunit
MAQPEQQAREEIDKLLTQAGWHVCDMAQANIHAARGVALREFPLDAGFGFADYLLYVDGKAAGVIEAKKLGATLFGVESQSSRYASGLPASLPAWRRPLLLSLSQTAPPRRRSRRLLSIAREPGAEVDANLRRAQGLRQAYGFRQHDVPQEI